MPRKNTKMSKLWILMQTLCLLVCNNLNTIHSWKFNISEILAQNDGTFEQREFLIWEYRSFLQENSTSKSIPRISTNDLSNEVDFHLYTKTSPNVSVILEPNLKSIATSPFDRNKETRFMTHGFWSCGQSDTSQTIKNSYLTYQDVNVIVVDWRGVAATANYIRAALSTVPIGGELAKMVDSLVEYGTDPKKIHLIGHSLGAHISGIAGKNSKYKVKRITGLDPAGPLFETFQLMRSHLSVGDADFVDVIHTAAGSLGYKEPLGDVDFYPNNGNAPQPGCKNEAYMIGDLAAMIDGCSHGRSWVYFADSINPHSLYEAKPTASNKKNLISFVQMGEYVNPYANGTFFVETNDKAPYSLNYTTT